MNKKFYLIALVLISFSIESNSQTKTEINLQQLLKENKLIAAHKITAITDGARKGITGTGLIWLKDWDFKEGTIEVDLKGQDVFQKSFLGVAFHGVDTVSYDVVYFRPFNFKTTDPIRKIHAVQYVSVPEYDWEKLREERNGQYEKAINPAPSPTDWFHVKVVLKNSEINVYVNNQSTSSLTVKTLNSRTSGLIGLWNLGLNAEFANLVISGSSVP